MNETNSALIAFTDYVGLKLHFGGDLVWKPDLKLRIVEGSLTKRADALYFHKAALKYKRRHEFVELLVSSLFRDRSFWIGDIEHQENLVFHKKRMRRAGAMLHTFRTDVENLCEYMEDNSLTLKALLGGVGVPLLIKSRRKIFGGMTDETIALLDLYFDFCSRAKTDDPLWNANAAAINRYKYFCRPSDDIRPEFDKLVYKLLGA